jgi:hypothetical protein
VLVKAGPTVHPPYLYAIDAANVQQHMACSWIDDDHLLAPTAVITIEPDAPTTNAMGNNVPSFVTRLPSTGTCAGRFPGGL